MFILGHFPFGFSIGLLCLVLALFVYLAVKMYKKSEESDRHMKHAILFTVLSVIVLLLIATAVIQHYHIHIGFGK